MIFVCVGSRNYPFNRLFQKLDELCEEGFLKDKIFAQIGASTYKPKHFEYKDFISQDEFLKKVKEADIVISHGASGSIMKALNAGKKVVAVTRLEKYGEHINDHQIQNNEAFAANNYVLAVYEMDELKDAIQKIYDGTDNLKPWENKDPMAIVNMIDKFIQENWKETKMDSEKLKYWYFQLHQVYSQNKIKKHSRKKVKEYLNEKKMTEEQKRKVENFYKPYKKITTDFHEFYYQKTGKFYENYLPDDLYYCDIDMYFNNWNIATVIDNKCLYKRLFPDFKQPNTIFYRVNNFWLNKDLKMIAKKELLKEIEKNDDLFVKLATDSAGGKGVFYIDNKNNNIKEKFIEIIDSNKQDLVVQEKLEQHKSLAAINESSVNTVRILSLLTDDGVKIYSAILRMGVNGAKVDNASSGGITCGIKEDGTLKDVAYFVNGDKYYEHPTTGVKFSGIKIPKFNEMKEKVIKNHPLIPHSRLVSWDIALDKNEDIVLIEANLKYGELDFHQLNNGPLFGDDTRKILDEVFSKK